MGLWGFSVQSMAVIIANSADESHTYLVFSSAAASLTALRPWVCGSRVGAPF